MKESRFTAGLLVCLAIVSGCSSGSTTRETETNPEVASAPVSEFAILFDERGLVSREFGSDTSLTIEPGIEFAGEIWPAPDQSAVAMTVRRGDETHLALARSDGKYLDVHDAGVDASYSVVWSPTSDSLLVGFSSPGDQGVSVFALEAGNLTSVGCGTSNIALSWGTEDWFVVGDQANHYVVERTGCATIESVDARKFHEVTFGPKGQRVGYILRELEYDRQTKQYAPDSSLYVSKSVGTDPVLVAGDRYSPRRPAWSPDAMALAFDVQLLDDPDRRLISIYELEGGSSAFLNPKAVDSKSSEWAAKWSPSGNAIAYLHSSKGKPPLVSVRDMANSFSTTVGKTGERLDGWLDDERLILTGLEGTRIVRTDGKQSMMIDGAATVISVGELRVGSTN